MKTKKKKTLESMKRETQRAIAHVMLLDKLYRETVESKKKDK